jgi:hypothetical protein
MLRFAQITDNGSEFAIVFCVTPLAITNRKSKAEAHDSERRDKHNENSAIDGSLALFRGGPGGRLAHGAALRERGGGPQS